MKRRTLIASIGAVAGTTLGAAAYSSATIERSATIGVTTDQQGLIQLTPGSVSQITQNNTTGELEINFSQLNGNSKFTFGDTAEPDVTNAFSLMQSESDHEITLDYTLDNDDPDGSVDNLQFEVFSGDSSADSLTTEGTATENDGATISTVSETEYYVVLTINTAGVDDSSATDLSGMLSITA